MKFNRNDSGFGGTGASGRKGPHRSARRISVPTVPTNEGDAIREIENVLVKWGIDPVKDEEHRSFAKAVKQNTADCFNSKLIENWQPQLAALPSDMSEALHLLLEHNLKQVTKDGNLTMKRETSDLIKESYDAFMPFPPYNLVRGDLKLSWAYKELRLPERELDPLVRFSYTKRDIKEYMLEQYGQVPDEEYPSHFIRALVLYEAVSGSYRWCLSCKSEGSLVWNSALRSDFSSLICSECGSAYTLCCVVDSQRVKKLLEKRTHFRGSYAHFHQLKSVMKEAGQIDAKMFMIFATRCATDSERLDNGLPVFAAEIKGALSNLNGDSFAPDHIRVKSNIVFESLNNGSPWFSVDIPKGIDVLGFSMNVFNSYFDMLEDNSYMPDDDKDEDAKPKTAQIGDSKPNVGLPDDKLRQQTANLKKIINQIDNIKGKKERGVNLEKWELDLLGREEKVLMKLEDLEG